MISKTDASMQIPRADMPHRWNIDEQGRKGWPKLDNEGDELCYFVSAISIFFFIEYL